MIRQRLCLTAFCSLFLLISSAVRAQEPKLPEDVQKAQQQVDEHLKKLGGPVAQILWLEPVSQTFPNHYFFAARYRQFPVARALPEGLQASNVFVVPKNGSLVRIKELKDLKDFMAKNLAAVKDEGTAKNAVKGCLHLAQEFHQDGFYKFSVVDETCKLEQKTGGKEASGKAVVMQGGNGEILVVLKFDEAGKLTDLSENAEIRPGPRPICQATKLLDADPIVRRMAEQDLLIMGLAARDYIMEQRAQAGPELRQAIDRLWQRIVEAGW